MRNLIIATLLLCSTAAFAEGGLTTTLSPAATQTATSSGVAAATNAGNTQSTTFTAPADTHAVTEIGGTETIKNVPSVSGPNLTTSNDTCMGSTSGSVNIAGLGIGGGSTWTDTNCKRLKNSRELWNMGMKGAAMALMCMDSDNKEALELTGYQCPVRKTDKVTATAAPTKTNPLSQR